jgi:hypothetical protein
MLGFHANCEAGERALSIVALKPPAPSDVRYSPDAA